MAALFGTLVGGIVDRVVRWGVLPFTAVIPILLRTGLLWLVFAGLWAGVALAIVVDPAALDALWRTIGGLPLLVQAVLWLVFLPVMAGMWAWSTDWPLVVRLSLVVGLAGWNLVTFLPRRESASPVPAPREA